MDMSATPSSLPATISDAALLERIRTGDARAAHDLMRRHNRTLYRTARAILRDDAEAEDALQDGYLHAFRAAETFRGDSSVSTWLVRIVANEALMRRRRESRRAQVIPMDAEAGGALVEQVADDEASGPETQAFRGEMRRLLERQVDLLPDLYRTVFVMRAVEEMSVDETAAALDLPEATVRTRFFRARALMRGALERDLDHALGDAFGFDGARCDRIVERVLGRLGDP